MWVANKREGCGRDPRLSGLGQRGALTQPLFGEAGLDWLETATVRTGAAVPTPVAALGAAAVAAGQAFLPVATSTLVPTIQVDSTIFEGSPAGMELSWAVVKSGADVIVHFQGLVTSSRGEPRSAIVHSLRNDCFSVFLIGCVDKLSGFKAAVYELIARRCLRAVRALQADPRSPDFSG